MLQNGIEYKNKMCAEILDKLDAVVIQVKIIEDENYFFALSRMLIDLRTDLLEIMDAAFLISSTLRVYDEIERKI